VHPKVNHHLLKIRKRLSSSELAENGNLLRTKLQKEIGLNRVQSNLLNPSWLLSGAVTASSDKDILKIETSSDALGFFLHNVHDSEMRFRTTVSLLQHAICHAVESFWFHSCRKDQGWTF
jgi:hypothetical protein